MFKEFLIAGLGNPGSQYTKTRHNAGALFIEALCKKYTATFKKNNTFNAQIASITLENTPLNDCKIYGLIPLDFMNHNGRAIQACMHYYRLSPAQLLVAQDELDLPLGTFRFKTGGGHAGHNGVRDVIQQLNNPDFHRLRLGIGHPQESMNVSDYVLSVPTPEESAQLTVAITEALQELPAWLEKIRASHGL